MWSLLQLLHQQSKAFLSRSFLRHSELYLSLSFFKGYWKRFDGKGIFNHPDEAQTLWNIITITVSASLQYVKQGIEELDDTKLGGLLVLKYNAIGNAKKALGDIPTIRYIFIGFKTYLYDDRAIIW